MKRVDYRRDRRDRRWRTRCAACAVACRRGRSWACSWVWVGEKVGLPRPSMCRAEWRRTERAGRGGSPLQPSIQIGGRPLREQKLHVWPLSKTAPGWAHEQARPSRQPANGLHRFCDARQQGPAWRLSAAPCAAAAWATTAVWSDRACSKLYRIERRPSVCKATARPPFTLIRCPWPTQRPPHRAARRHHERRPPGAGGCIATAVRCCWLAWPHWPSGWCCPGWVGACPSSSCCLRWSWLRCCGAAGPACWCWAWAW